MNDTCKNSIVSRLISAMEKEKLSAKETGAILGTLPQYISMMKKTEFWKNCPVKAWEVALAWVNSGYSLHDWRTKNPNRIKLNITTAGEIDPKAFEGKEIIEEGFEDGHPVKVVDDSKAEPLDKYEIVLGFIKAAGTVVKVANGDEYYYLPFWYKQIKPGNSFEMLTFDRLPKEVKDIIKSLRGE